MNAQDLILGARVAHLRELKTEIEKLKAEKAALQAENEALKAHFAFALLAAQDLAALPTGGRMEIWDGWNLVLGAKKEATDIKALIAEAERKTAEDERLFVWIVLDGADERVRVNGRVRISYTGGSGLHRADRLIVDFVRMAAYRGLGDRIHVWTNDKDFLRNVRALTKLRA